MCTASCRPCARLALAVEAKPFLIENGLKKNFHESAVTSRRKQLCAHPRVKTCKRANADIVRDAYYQELTRGS